MPDALSSSLPDKAKIDGLTWKIISEGSDGRLIEDGILGETLGTKLLIRIRVDIAEELVAESLLHEIVHAIQVTYLSPDDRPSEHFVKTFSIGLFGFLRDNPDVVDFITNKKKQPHDLASEG